MAMLMQSSGRVFPGPGQAAHHHGRAPRAAPLVCAAQGGKPGFGRSNKKVVETSDSAYVQRTSKRRVDIQQEMSDAPRKKDGAAASTSKAAPANLGEGNWFELAKVADLEPTGRKLCELSATKQFVLLQQVKDKVYAMDAMSTAYKYPLVDGKVTEEKDGPAIEVPLDGTQYDLATGKVLKWCPKEGGVVRSLLSTLKGGVPAVPLPVYPVVVKPEGAIYVRLS